MLSRRLIGLVAALAGGCSNPLERVPPGPPLPAPLQEELPSGAEPFRLEGFTVTPRARYHVEAIALITDTPDDPWSHAAPVDVALGWGPMRAPALLGQLSFHLSRRYVSVRWSGDFPLSSKQVMQNLANHHLVPHDAEVEDEIRAIRAGDRVVLDGLLVDLSAPGQPPMRTSLTRDDIGNGACEVMYVTRVSRQPLP